MFKRMKTRFQDMRTVTVLCHGAERIANQDGEREPGLEHFVLAACELPDGSATRVLAGLGKSPEDFRRAVAEQYRAALANAGIDVADMEATPVPASNGLYRAKPQTGQLMTRLSDSCDDRGGAPLTGADMLAAIAGFEHGVAARSFASMGIPLPQLAAIARTVNR